MPICAICAGRLSSVLKNNLSTNKMPPIFLQHENQVVAASGDSEF